MQEKLENRYIVVSYFVKHLWVKSKKEVFHALKMFTASQHWTWIGHSWNATLLNRKGEWKYGNDLINLWNITWIFDFPDNTRGCR